VSRRSRTSLAVATALLAACTTTPAPGHPRPTTTAPATTAAAPIGRVDVTEIDVTEEDDGSGRSTGVLRCGPENVRFDLLRGPTTDAPRPLVLLVPILAGGKDLMESIASRMVDRSFDVAFCARVGSALSAPQRTRDLDELFRRTVLHQRILIAWLRQQPTPPSSICLLGVSMGGIVSTVVAALEPELDGVAICLSGGDLAGMVTCSSERRVERWVTFRHREDGVGDDHLQWELAQGLTHEPLGFAAAVPTEKVLFVGARFDSVVPPRHQSLLWEALGRPTRLDVPLGHYSAALAIGAILDACAAHFEQRLAMRRTATALAAPGR